MLTVCRRHPHPRGNWFATRVLCSVLFGSVTWFWYHGESEGIVAQGKTRLNRKYLVGLKWSITSSPKLDHLSTAYQCSVLRQSRFLDFMVNACFLVYWFSLIVGWFKRSLNQSIGSFSTNPHFALFWPDRRSDTFGNVSNHWGMVTYTFFWNNFFWVIN